MSDMGGVCEYPGNHTKQEKDSHSFRPVNLGTIDFNQAVPAWDYGQATHSLRLYIADSKSPVFGLETFTDFVGVTHTLNHQRHLRTSKSFNAMDTRRIVTSV